MTTATEMAQSLDKLPDDFDFSDPNALAAAMGYDQGTSEDDGSDDQQDESTTQQATADEGKAAAPAPAPSAAAASPAAPTDGQKPAGVEQGSASSDAAAKNELGEVVGVQTKDGKHTLPYGVLQEARRAAAMNKARAEELETETTKLKEQIESLKSGKAQAGEGPSEEEMAKLVEDFPQLAPVLQQVKALQAKVASAEQAAPKVDPRAQIDQELDAQAELDAALASRPLLSRYQATGGVVWGRAIEIDAELMSSPDFRGKPIGERFAEVEKRLAGELGIQAPAATTSTPPAKTTTPPVSQAALAAAPAVGPSTLSDISGTAPAVEKDPWDDRSALEGLAAAEKLSDEGLMRLAGVSY